MDVCEKIFATQCDDINNKIEKVKNDQSILDYHDIIAAIVAAIEARDYHTAHHSVRVSNMSEEICHLLKMSKEDTELIHIAADLHDIGKIGVSDSVLLKKGSLDDSEWAEMKSHTFIGDYILKKLTVLKE